MELRNPTIKGKNREWKPHQTVISLYREQQSESWVLINTKDKNDNNKIVLLEVNRNKDNVEIVHWHYTDERGAEKIRKQTEREDGQLLILPSVETEEVGALSDPTLGLSSEDKDSNLSEENKGSHKINKNQTKAIKRKISFISEVHKKNNSYICVKENKFFKEINVPFVPYLSPDF